MKEIIDKFMNDETTRLFCFFMRVQFDHEKKICQGCARFELCKRDAKKMLKFLGYIPWIETPIEREWRKFSKECPVCG